MKEKKGSSKLHFIETKTYHPRVRLSLVQP